MSKSPVRFLAKNQFNLLCRFQARYFKEQDIDGKFNVAMITDDDFCLSFGKSSTLLLRYFAPAATRERMRVRDSRNQSFAKHSTFQDVSILN